MSMVPPVSDPVLEIDALHVTYGTSDRVVHAVRDATLVVNEGEAVGIAGESGCGKSTLARALLGLLPERIGRIAGGRIRVAGQDLTDNDEAQWTALHGHPLAMVFQDPLSFLNPVLRIGVQIAENVRQHDPNQDIRQRCVELLDLVKLPASVLRSYPHELSGGMRQRVMLAIALGCRPRHPYTSGLIATSRLLRGANGRFGALQGEVSTMDSGDAGCPFAPRCPKVHAQCWERMPGEFAVTESHRAKCWLLQACDAVA
jgi:oligopeptide/dipeptide ABC transporter ATP-binding protein